MFSQMEELQKENDELKLKVQGLEERLKKLDEKMKNPVITVATLSSIISFIIGGSSILVIFFSTVALPA